MTTSLVVGGLLSKIICEKSIKEVCNVGRIKTYKVTLAWCYAYWRWDCILNIQSLWGQNDQEVIDFHIEESKKDFARQVARELLDHSFFEK